MPVRIALDEPSFVTLVIEDVDGRRVRNLTAGTHLGAGTHAFQWDCYDEGLPKGLAAGNPWVRRLVEPGKYRVRGCVHRGIRLAYEFSVNSPGAPPWKTQDSSGAWMADHTAPSDCLFLPAASGNPHGANEDQMLLGSACAECGHAMVWTGLDGRKRVGRSWGWMGPKALARDGGRNAASDHYAYAAYFEGRDAGVLRGLTADGKDPELLRWKTAEALPVIDEWSFVDVEVRDGVAVVSNSDNRDAADEKAGNLMVVDVRSRKVLANHAFPATRGVAFDRKGRLLALIEGKLVSFAVDGATGALTDRRVLVDAGLEAPRRVRALDSGEILISDWGERHQVLVFGESGDLRRRIGAPGGPQIGRYDERRMYRPDGFAVDSAGVLWVAENTNVPKRVSLWDLRTGGFLRAIYGGPQYGGGGTIDPQDKTRFHYSQNVAAEKGGMLFRLDWEKGTSRLESIYYRCPVPARADAYSWDAIHAARREGLGGTDVLGPWPPAVPYHAGGHRYVTNIGHNRHGDGPSLDIWLLDGEIAKPVAAIGPNWDGLVKRHVDSPTGSHYCWVDRNGDGRVQKDEFQFADLGLKEPRLMGYSVLPDLAVACFGLSKGLIPAPSIDGKGVPHYDLSRIAPLAKPSGLNYHDEAGIPVVGSNGDVVLASYGWDFDTPIQGYGHGGTLRWIYRNYPHSVVTQHAGQVVHGSMNIGPTARPVAGEAGEIWCTNGGKGAVYLFTTDGLFLTHLGGDMRTTPLWRFPEAKRGMAIDDVSWEDECFQPSFRQAADGEVYVVTGKEHSSILRLTGLESVRRRDWGTVAVTPAHVRGPPAELVEEPRQQLRRTRDVFIVDWDPVVDGSFEEWRIPEDGWTEIDARTRAATVIRGDRLYAAFDTGDSDLLVNGAEDPRLAFKHGGTLELMFSTAYDPGIPVRTEVAAADLRLLVTRIKGAPTAVLYRPIAPDAPAAERMLFESPIGSITMDSVKVVSSEIEFASEGGRYELSIPLSLVTAIPVDRLGIQPWHADKGRLVIGDVGILRGDGRQTIQRVYWNNLDTAIVSDLPSEARLKPMNWGLFRLVRLPETAPVEAPAASERGLDYEYFDLPDLEDGELRSWSWLEREPSARGHVPAPTLDVRTRDERYGIRFTGRMAIPTEGVYRIGTAADDGVRLWLGDRLVCDGNVTELVRLAAGAYPVRVEFWQGPGGQHLHLRWSGPGFDYQDIPAETWSR